MPRKSAPENSRTVSLHIGASFRAAWENVLLPWFESVATSAFTESEPVAVITPFASDATFLRSKLLERGISLREHLRLLLAVAAEQFVSENNEAKIDHNGTPTVSIAKSVERDPDHFLRALDQLGAAGWSFDEIGPGALRQIAARFEKIVRDCGFQF